MTDRYEKIRKARKALEDLRERCAQEAERITGRRRAVAAMSNNEAVKPCEVAAVIRKIDVQQYYECVAREIKALLVERDALREALETMVEMVEMNGFGRAYAMDVARAALAKENSND